MAVHFKFKSAKEFDTITFESTFIRVGDLKREIVRKKNLDKGLDFELVLTNAQTQEGEPRCAPTRCA